MEMGKEKCNTLARKYIPCISVKNNLMAWWISDMLLESFLAKLTMWFFQFSLQSINTPSDFVTHTLSALTLLRETLRVLLTLKSNLQTAN